VFQNAFGLIEATLSTSYPTTGWVAGGATYAAYNAVSAVVVLPMLRHLTSSKDAVISGLLCGPLGMLPAIVFFVCMTGFYPQIASEPLPSDYILRQLDVPVFHVLFQLMIFAALLESGVGLVHAINERIAGVLHARGRSLSTASRLWIAGGLLVGSIFIAERFGLVALIAHGYRWLAYGFVAVFVAPVLTYGLWSCLRSQRAAAVAQ
jgi:uncharacterized membrane protein YkvI